VASSSGPSTLRRGEPAREVGTATVALYGEGASNVLVGSPLGVRYTAGEPFPSSCYLEGLVNGTGAGGTLTVDIYARDAFFNPVPNVTVGADFNALQ